jgi:hypothetical protein
VYMTEYRLYLLYSMSLFRFFFFQSVCACLPYLAVVTERMSELTELIVLLQMIIGKSTGREH